MAILEIRGGGDVLLDGELVGKIEYTRPFLESSVQGEWYDDDEFSRWFDVEIMKPFEAQVLGGGSDAD